MSTRYFRKRDPASIADAVEWVEMSGKEYYRFVTDPQNKGRCFHNMGDIVLECTRAEYKKFKAEDDHSSYILEQEAGWITLSLESVIREKGICSEEVIADTSQNVEELAIRNLVHQDLMEILCSLPQQDYRIIYELYLANPQKTVHQLSAESGIPVMTLQDKKSKILSRLYNQMQSQKNFKNSVQTRKKFAIERRREN